jgi:mono/diheme cytochrome c family protein
LSYCRLNLAVAIGVIASCVGLIGCANTSPPEFRVNAVELLKQERLSLPDDEHFDTSYPQQIGTILYALFGTPNQPLFPLFGGAEDPVHEILSLANLQLAAGPVNSDKSGTPSGLYREHCAHCHGISGDGAGPTAAILNPYPRDFRLGKFKFKSTPLRQPPTDHDLLTLLKNGIPGTAMPSFRTLPEEELIALIDYVKYLTIRGQFERYLMAELASLDGDPIIDLSLIKSIEPTEDDRAAFEDQAHAIVGDGLLDGIVNRWVDPEKRITNVPPAPAAVDPTHALHGDLVDQGRQLFFSKGSCMQCHGETGLGDGQLGNFDDWTKEWIKTSGVNAFDPTTYQSFLAAGALPPRPIRPRNLRAPVYRGGNRPQDLFLRIANGIEGTPMPSAVSLKPEEIWALVAFVKSLPFEDGQTNTAH